MRTDAHALLQVNDVTVTYHPRGSGFGRRPSLQTVDGVSLTVGRGESLAVVGESGCGKSSLARAVVGLEALSAGQIRLHGTSLGTRRTRSAQRRVQMVFQDPVLSLNPRRKVKGVLAELLRAHHLVPASAIDERCEQLLAEVGLPARVLDAHPGELSGGQRQRVGIARALALEPDVLVADEPVSALDVSVQATILTLLADLQQRFGLALLFISHDLGVVRHLCERVAVMYLGRIVEQGPTDEIFQAPRHPYTQALLRAAPSLQRPTRPGASGLPGEPPSPTGRHVGCRFAGRCPAVIDRCRTDDPPVTVLATGPTQAPHEVWCHVRPPPAANRHKAGRLDGAPRLAPAYPATT